MSYGRKLAGILAAGVLARLLVVLAIPTRPVSDFWGYFLSAQSLASSGRYEIVPNEPIGGHPPAYPLLLSVALRAAPPGRELLAAKLANLLLAAAAGWIGAALARRLWGETAGLWTAAWVAFFPRSLLMADLIASENLFAPLLLLFVLLIACSWTKPRSAALAVAIGVVAGSLALTRSVAYVLPLVWLLGALVARRPARVWVVELLLLLAAEHSVLLPWAIRNERALGRFTFLSTLGGAGLFIGNNAHATGEWYPWAGDLERLRPGIHAHGAVAVDDAARQEAWWWIREHPGKAARLYVRKLEIIMADDSIVAGFAIFGESVSPPFPPGPVLPGPHPLKAHARLVRSVLRLSGLLLAVCALGGFLVLLRRAREGSVLDRALAVTFAAAALSVPLLSAAIAVNGRYRWPSEDTIMPLAGFFLARITHGRM